MKFANNWIQEITLAPGVTSVAMDLPDGSYRLTLSDASIATRWEIVGAVVVAGTATLTRALEGTTDQDWPDGSLIYSSITAGLLADVFAQLADLQQRIATLESTTPDNALTDEANNLLTDQDDVPLTGDPV